MEISTFLPCACLARMALRKSASDSTLEHSETEQRLNRMSPEVTEVGSPNARSMMSQAFGMSAIRTYPEPLAKDTCMYPISACRASPVLVQPVVLALTSLLCGDSPASLNAATA